MPAASNCSSSAVSLTGCWLTLDASSRSATSSTLASQCNSWIGAPAKCGRAKSWRSKMTKSPCTKTAPARSGSSLTRPSIRAQIAIGLKVNHRPSTFNYLHKSQAAMTSVAGTRSRLPTSICSIRWERLRASISAQLQSNARQDRLASSVCHVESRHGHLTQQRRRVKVGVGRALTQYPTQSSPEQWSKVLGKPYHGAKINVLKTDVTVMSRPTAVVGWVPVERPVLIPKPSVTGNK